MKAPPSAPDICSLRPATRLMRLSDGPSGPISSGPCKPALIQVHPSAHRPWGEGPSQRRAIQLEHRAIQLEHRAIQLEHRAIKLEHQAIQLEHRAIQQEHRAPRISQELCHNQENTNPYPARGTAMRLELPLHCEFI